MTDLETMKSMLERRGIPYSVGRHEDELVISVESGGNNVRSYSGFTFEMYFHLDGSLLAVGAEEA